VQASGFDELAEEVRKGNYNIDATAIAERLNNLKLLLR
jgi:anti-sigma28 factor (negative regulator of flagellin synthesis)